MTTATAEQKPKAATQGNYQYPKRYHRLTCPLVTLEKADCLEAACAWWAGDMCAIKKIALLLERIAAGLAR